MQPSPFIELRSGQRFQPLEPIVHHISIEDVAYGLSHQFRFSGHSSYTVAEHSVRVSEYLESRGCSKAVCLWGLLHDASEGLGLPDLASPVKNSPAFAFYREAEARLMRAVCFRFGLPLEEPPAVREADLRLLATEAKSLMPFQPENWAQLKYPPLDIEIVPWSSEVARKKFISRYLKVCE